MIYYKDGAKMMMPVLTKEEYMAIRNGGEQRERVKRIRQGEETLKTELFMSAQRGRLAEGQYTYE